MTQDARTSPPLDWSAAEAASAAHSRLQHQASAANRAALFDALAARTITAVVVGFDGSGDSGQIEGVDAFANDADASMTGLEAPFATVAWGASEVSVRPAPLGEIAEAVAYDLLEAGHGGWEDNEGAFGEFTFNVAQRSIRLEFNQRIETSELTVFEL